ncbi:hypothetical protein ATZ99_02790 [Thermovenabulum gondwanense]|uniref:Uncharacterized protein n=1 Tax=Thermovenabulum gondwanense TaxID=520767 RepID=A0A161PWG1_9FIRM|nr:hypothetical protein ATZ99_02790 [Thermovenabulum gondwanense]
MYLETGFEDAITILENLEHYRKRLRIINALERLNEEIRRRERIIRIFHNRESAICLIRALLMEQDEKRTSGKKYLDMVEYFEWQKENAKKAKEKIVSIS